MTASTAVPSAVPTASSRLARGAHLIGRFLAGQLLVQAVNLTTGLLLIRWLAVEQFAQFSVAFAFQTTINMLVDVGFSNSIIALVGQRGSDPAVVGGFLKSAAHYRNRMFFVIGAAAAFAFPLVTYRQHWGFGVKAWLFAAIISSVLLQRQIMYGAPLLINRRLAPYYFAQVLAGVVRLGMAFVLLKAGLLTAIATAWLSTVAIAINGLIYRLQSRPLICEPRHADPVFNREMIQLITPLIPGIIFTAFQAQISVGIITLFGRTTNIAEVSALGRLAQLFVVFSAFNTVIVEPHMARLPTLLLPRRYAQLGLCSVLGAAAIAAGAFLVPGPLLFLLGSHYHSLGSDVGWVVAGACVSYVASVFWVMNSARKFLYWWYTGAYIVTVVLSQTACVLFLDLSTTRNVLYFMLITNAATLLVHIAAGVYGIGRKQIGSAITIPPDAGITQTVNP
jgi:O-antigen/teichoic acid export membrane protein